MNNHPAKGRLKNVRKRGIYMECVYVKEARKKDGPFFT
ncbi:hypothetical protein B4100_2663 [Heyndrickxia coagulans]|nr:hypothetical protein B4100_2663 [Heyndrickxia coagulans]